MRREDGVIDGTISSPFHSLTLEGYTGTRPVRRIRGCPWSQGARESRLALAQVFLLILSGRSK